ncbi:MAG: YcgN family cysteine cluster protein [Pelagimonas sp.]|uniref:YcgN family cysteine cluster protein n=1 Tax=Pelagimonas sp. TaxID=2073170 RepID=UPI003D6BB4F6
MSDQINRTGLSDRFWEHKRMDEMSGAEWEALCDGCGKCCLNKLEDEDTGEVALTRVACRLLDDTTCLCAKYEIRHKFVPECIVLRPGNIEKNLYWMPETCAYKRVWNNAPLPDWHPLITGRSESVHEAGVSMRGQTVSEYDIADEDWEDHIIEEPV